MGEALSKMERVQATPGTLIRLDGDQWYSSFYASETHDPLDARVILVCERGYYRDRDNVTTDQYEFRVGDLFKDWTLPK